MSNGRFGGDRGRVAELMCELMRLEMEGESRDELGRGKRPIAGCGMHWSGSALGPVGAALDCDAEEVPSI